MFHVPDQIDVVYKDAFLESTSYFGRRFDERPEDAIQHDESRLDSDYSDFCLPVEDWLLD